MCFQLTTKLQFLDAVLDLPQMQAWLSLESSLKIQPLTALFTVRILLPIKTRLLGLLTAIHAALLTLPESTQGCLNLRGIMTYSFNLGYGSLCDSRLNC